MSTLQKEPAMFQLNNRVALKEKRKRIGRGGSRGGTSGKGGKGQKARTGGASKIRPAFEGGQMPLHRRLPKRGFNNAQFRTELVIVNLGDIERCFEAGAAVTKETLVEKGLIKSAKHAVKLLGDGVLTKKITITIDACSMKAIEAIKVSGGEVHLIKEA